jgi:hypothetical protein
VPGAFLAQRLEDAGQLRSIRSQLV